MSSACYCTACLSALLLKPPTGIIITDDTQVFMHDWTQIHKQSDENILSAQPEVLSFFYTVAFSLKQNITTNSRQHSV